MVVVVPVKLGIEKLWEGFITSGLDEVGGRGHGWPTGGAAGGADVAVGPWRPRSDT
jgi:hypothetical protein